MIVDRMVALFGENPAFTLEIAQKMKEKMLEDLNSVPPRKEEYMSEMGDCSISQVGNSLRK